MDKQFHTLNEGIPKDKSHVKIGMDTGNDRNWLDLWITEWGTITDLTLPTHPKKALGESYFISSLSVRLTRDDAINLIEEIKHRLF